MENKSKIPGIIKSILLSGLFIFSVFVMIFTVVSVSVLNKNNKSLFGYQAYIVLSDSMNDTFDSGDIIFCKKVDPSTLVEGDIITFQSINPTSLGEIITHKIKKVYTSPSGIISFETYGTNTGVSDEKLVTTDKLFGKYYFRIPKIGKFFLFLKTTLGFLFLIALPFTILITFQTIEVYKNVRLLREEIRNEKSNLELLKKQEELERLKEELRVLREELGNTSSNESGNEE